MAQADVARKTHPGSLPDAIPELLPFHEHNRTLASNVHPPDWVNPDPAGRYNLVVLGAGTAGLVTAAGAAGLGARVALVERRLMGGDCLNVGCVPSKALIRAAHVASQVRRAGELGVRVGGDVEVDFVEVMERMRRLRAEISHDDSAARFRDLGVDVFIGDGRFEGPGVVSVGERRLSYKKAVIATGARASELPIQGLAEAGYLTNETIFSLTRLPRRLGVIGAGPIGCELAQAFARFGSEVFLVEALHGIMPREDPEASEIVAQQMRQDGVTIMCCGKNLEIRRQADGKHLVVDSHDEHYDIAVDEILVGVGRSPNVEGLNLESVGVEVGPTGVKVNDRLQTTGKGIYAAGDICSAYKFTHSADAMARLVIQNALFFGRARASALTIPWCTYTAPEVAHVGLYEEEAKKKGLEVTTVQVPMSEVHRAVLDGETQGFVKVLLKAGSDRILGATVVAKGAGDLISELTLAMVAGKGLGTLAATIHPYPTRGELIKKAGDAYNRTRLTPGVKRLFERLMAWQR